MDKKISIRFLTGVLTIAIFIFGLAGCCANKKETAKSAGDRISEGKKYAAQNKMEDAIREFRAAKLLDPANLEANYELGLSYYKLKDFKRAEESLKTALKINSKDPRIYNMLGLIFERQGLFDDARKSFGEAMRLNKKFEEARFNLMNIEKAKSEYAFYKVAMDFIYVLSKEYSNGNNSFMRGIKESKAVKNEFGTVTRYDVNSEVYLAKEYFDKCSKFLEKMSDRISGIDEVVGIGDAFSSAIQERQEAIDLQVEGYATEGSYSGEFERAEAKIKIADTYYVDAAKKLEAVMSEEPLLFDEKDFSNIRRLISYYSKEKTGEVEAP